MAGPQKKIRRPQPAAVKTKTKPTGKPEPKKETSQDPNQEKKDQQKKEDFMLIRQAVCGEQKAFSILMQRYRSQIFGLMFKMTHAADEAEDLVQEAFMKAFTSLAHFNYEFAFSTWLYKIASNNCIDHLRKKKLQTFSIDAPVMHKDDEYHYEIADLTYYPDKDLIRRERSDLIRAAIDSLPFRYREVIQLRHTEELSYEEISDKLKIPIGTVKARLFRAREMLNQYLKDKIEKV